VYISVSFLLILLNIDCNVGNLRKMSTLDRIAAASGTNAELLQMLAQTGECCLITYFFFWSIGFVWS
jgi:hypothetical protein